MPVPPPRLVTTGTTSAVGQTLDLPADGLVLTLKLPAVAPARLELTQAELVLTSPSGTVDLTGGTSAGLTVTTNLGALSAGWTSEKANDVTWLVADWGVRRPLASIKVDLVSNPDPKKEARLRISDGGVWFPVQSVETVPFGVERSLPDVVASRIMLEVVLPKGNGVYEASAGRVSGFTVKLGAQPQDLSVGVGPRPPVFERPGRLVAGQQVQVVNGLRDALQQQVPRDGSAADVPVVIRDALRGRVTVTSATFAALSVYSALDGARTSLPLTWGAEALGQLTLNPGATLTELRFTLLAELLAERFLVEGRVADVAPYAQLCDGGHEAAQGFPGLGTSALAGVDVLLRPLSERVAGTLALHPDVLGRPSEVPYTGARVPFAWNAPGPKPWAAGFIPVQLSEPVGLPERWWLVLTLSEGEALWPLSATVPALAGGLGPVLRRLSGNVWTEWEAPPAQGWALGRLRVTSKAAAPPFKVELRRGAVKKPVTVDGSGGVVAPADVLTALNGATGPVTVAVASAGAPVSGTLKLDGLRVAVREPV